MTQTPTNKAVREALEEWRDIPGYEGCYQASNLGRIKSVRRGIIMRPFSNGRYQQIILSVSGKKSIPTIHRLVMEAFVGKSELTIDHKDGNKINNRLDNLEYVTNHENIQRYFAGKRDLPFGVYRSKSGRSFHAVLSRNKKDIHIGTFQTVEDAVLAREIVETNLRNYAQIEKDVSHDTRI